MTNSALPSSAGEADGPTIEVALATYNSETYLAQLLDSLFAQTRQDFTLLVSDDGSSDRTNAILCNYARRYEGRIRFMPPSPEPRGALANFARLIDTVRADYVLLCDHDDVWLPEKIEASVERLQAMEQRSSPETPLLLHTDLVVVGPDLEVLGASYFRYVGIDPRRNDLLTLLLANVATGCTTIMNRALYERARPIPPEAIMHDHWLAIVASVCGVVEVIDKPYILYRQHERNVIGATPRSVTTTVERIRETLFSDHRHSVLVRYGRQARVLLERFGEEMTEEQRRAASTLATLWSIRRWRRFVRLRRSGLGFSGVLRNIALFFVVTCRTPPGR